MAKMQFGLSVSTCFDIPKIQPGLLIFSKELNLNRQLSNVVCQTYIRMIPGMPRVHPDHLLKYRILLHWLRDYFLIFRRLSRLPTNTQLYQSTYSVCQHHPKLVDNIHVSLRCSLRYLFIDFVENSSPLLFFMRLVPKIGNYDLIE